MFSLSFFVFIDNDSEDEGPSKANTEKKIAELAEVAEGQEDDSCEAVNGEADDEDGIEEEEDEISQQAEGGSSSSERDGKAQSASMSSRSESKPYSSVTHKCEVRNIIFTICYHFTLVFSVVLFSTGCGIAQHDKCASF